MALSLNIDGLSNEVVPNIDNCKNQLKYAEDILSSISIPTDFSYRSTLLAFPDRVRNAENTSIQLNSWVQSVISNFSSAESNSINQLQQCVSKITNVVLTPSLKRIKHSKRKKSRHFNISRKYYQWCRRFFRIADVR